MATSTVKRIKAGVIIFYILLLGGLTLYDERSDPALLAEMTRPLAKFTGPGNAYIALLGFDAPAGANPFGIGQRKLDIMQKAFAARAGFGEYFESIEEEKKKLDFRGEKPVFYDKTGAGILKYLSHHSADAEKLISGNRELLDRYRALHAYTEYREPLDYAFYMPFIRMTPLRNTQLLYFIDIAAKARKGRSVEALAALQRDMEFWRRVASDSRTLISKLFSFAMLRSDILFAAELGAVKGRGARERALIQDILRPFDAGEASLAGDFRSEARYMYKTLELSIEPNAGPLDRLIYKRHATDNRMFAQVQDMVRLAELSPDKFAEKAQVLEDEREPPYRIGLPFLYNPTGEMLVLIGSSQGWHRYIEKGHNLEGLRRLAWLKILAHRERIQPENIGRFLNTASPDLKDPYTGGLMKWDQAKRSIYFPAVSKGNRVELFLND